MEDRYKGMAKVAAVIDDLRFVINRGSDNGIEAGQLFLVFRLGDSISDPDTDEDLGTLEIVLGRARVIHIQENISTLESSEEEIVPGDIRRIRRSRYTGLLVLGAAPTEEEIEEGRQKRKRRLGVSIGDLVRPV